MAEEPSPSETHARLARRLGARAFLGLALLGLVAFGFALGAVSGVAQTWHFLTSGAVLAAFVSVGVFMLCLAASLRSIDWLVSTADAPEGILLPREAAPSLHRMIERIGRRFGNVRIDTVRVTGDMNAAILQRPRWGFVGRMETHLLIGLPLAHSVSRRQFGAILAHEFAHVAFQRRGLGAWSSYLRAWWFRVVDRIITDCPRISPLLERWTTAGLADAVRLSRLEEFDADEKAARVVGPRLLGETLIEVALKERFLSEDYWHKVMAQSKVRSRPSIRPYREMGLGMVAGFRRPAPGAAHIDRLIADYASPMDFHPSLLERLHALGVPPEVPTIERPSAATRYLTPILPSLAWVFDRAWWEGTRRTWRQRYRGMPRD